MPSTTHAHPKQPRLRTRDVAFDHRSPPAIKQATQFTCPSLRNRQTALPAFFNGSSKIDCSADQP
ncbi:hypothetical protein K456DRAFT_44521 [Colletotrichum gloeosporioides 23]|nr:hypothetical protein K456DRAFT_44521 [Colletotrichum gloeosporioides 23]